MLSHQLKNQVDRLERYDENNDDSDLYKIQSSSELLMKMVVVTGESDKISNNHLRFCPLGFLPHTFSFMSDGNSDL